MITTTLIHFGRRLRILWLGLRGEVEFRLGSRDRDFDQACATFRRLAEIDRDSFVAHLHLGRIAEDRLQVRAAIAHYTRAYQLDAERFARSPIAAEIKHRIMTRERLIRSGLHRHAREELGGISPLPAAGPIHAAVDLSRTDFSSLEEWERLRVLPVIAEEDLLTVDLDALADALGRCD